MTPWPKCSLRQQQKCLSKCFTCWTCFGYIFSLDRLIFFLSTTYALFQKSIVSYCTLWQKSSESLHENRPCHGLVAGRGSFSFPGKWRGIPRSVAVKDLFYFTVQYNGTVYLALVFSSIFWGESKAVVPDFTTDVYVRTAVHAMLSFSVSFWSFCISFYFVASLRQDGMPRNR